MEAVISLRRSVRFGFAVALGLVCGCMEGNVGSSRNVPINEISIECGGGKIGDASEELSKHLSLVAGSKFVSAMQNPALTIVLGVKAPGEGETADFTSYAKLVGDKLYLWGDDREDRPGTLFAVYGFLETILGVVWPMPGDDNIVAPAADRLNIPQNWSWRYCPPLKSGMMRGGDLQRKRLFDRRGNFAPMALRRSQDRSLQTERTSQDGNSDRRCLYARTFCSDMHLVVGTVNISKRIPSIWLCSRMESAAHRRRCAISAT